MSDLIFSSTDVQEYDGICGHQVSDCFVMPEEAREYVQQNLQKFTLSERQLFRLISNKDVISKQGTEMLLRKVNVESLINRGVIKQSSPCSEFCEKLRCTSNAKHQDDISQTTVMKNQIAHQVTQQEYEDIEPALRFIAEG